MLDRLSKGIHIRGHGKDRLFSCAHCSIDPCLLFSNHQGQGWVHSLKNNTAQTAQWWGQTNYMHGMGAAAFVYLRRKASIVS